uniref:uncharacterized protein n=1 Tax=Myxine glutinosa TaxID=7769 RepID=UPI00358EC1B0
MESKGAEDKICPVPAWLEIQGLTEESLRATVTGLGIEILGALCARAEPASARVRLCSLVAQKFTFTMYTELCQYMESRHVQQDLKWPLVPAHGKAHGDEADEDEESIIFLGMNEEDEDFVDHAVEGRDLDDGMHEKFTKKFPCTSCSHSFTTKASLKMHMKRHRPVSSDTMYKRIHNGDKPYSCTICGKRFHRSSNLEVHMRSHTGDHLYSCKVCGKSFASEAVLLIHALVHSGEKPYVCNICGKRFSRSFRCRVHMHSHTRECPCKCTICGKEFDELIYYQYHMRTHTWDRTYTCNVCAKTFSQQSSLISHTLIHSDNPVPTTMDGNLDYLMDHEFCKLPFEQQLRIKREGRPSPKLDITHVDGPSKCVKRRFSEEMYKKTDWLTGSMTQRRLYCWPCLLFDSKESSDGVASATNSNPWTKKGFSDLKNLSRAIERHGKSKAHVTASLKLKLFDQVRINEDSSRAATNGAKNHNEQVTKNRDILRRLINAVLFLGKRELAFWGHDKSRASCNEGDFVELAQILTEYDDVLAEHLKCAAVFRDLSKTIRHDIIDSIAHIVNDEIDSEIATAPFISVQVDDATDFSCKPQLTIVVRYVNKKGDICERFLGFLDISQDRTPETLTAIILRRLDKYNPTVKLVSQSYDGASCMAGQSSGVGACVNSVCPYVLFIHSYAHDLQQVLSQGTRAIQDAKLFFACLDGFQKNFPHSSKQTSLLEEAGARRGRVPSGSASIWNFKSHAVQAVYEGRQSLKIVFNRVINEPGCDGESIARSVALKRTLCDFKFVFLLSVFRAIFGRAEVLLETLRFKPLDLLKSFDVIDSTLLALSQLRNNARFKGFYEETLQLLGHEEESKRKRSRHDLNTTEMYKRLYFDVLDAIICQLSERFIDMKKLDFFQILDCKLFKDVSKGKAFPLKEMKVLLETYPFFDEQRLKNELQAIYEDASFHKPPGELFKFIMENGLSETIPEVCKLLKLMLTIPLTGVSGESSFSCLKGMKTYLRDTKGQHRLSALACISIESNLLQDLKSQDCLYDRVMDRFAKMKDRQMEFFYM